MSSLRKNVSTLVVVQIISYLVPLLQVPYLTRTIGVELYGVYAYSLVLLQLANLVIDFGFNLYYPQLIATGRNNQHKIGELIYSCLIIKLLLFIPVTIIFGLLFLTNKNYSDFYLFFSISFLTIIGNAFTFVWLFQGLEKLYLYSRIMILTKIISLCLIVLFVKEKDDFIKIAIINSFQQIFVMLYCLYWTTFYLKIKIKKVKWKFVTIIAVRSFDFFFSRAFVAIYTSGCGLLIGYLGTASQMAVFSAAEQLYKSAQQVFNPVSQALYPYMVRTKNYSVFFKLLYASLAICIFGCTVGWIWGQSIINILYGAHFSDSYIILAILLVALIFNTMAVLLGYPALVPIGLAKIANRSVIYAGILQLLLFLLISTQSKQMLPIYVACSIVISEFFVMILRGYALVKGQR